MKSPQADLDKTNHLTTRGTYWEERLAVNYGLHVPAGYHYLACTPIEGGAYGLTIYKVKLILVDSRIWDVGLAHVDEMLVHELIHATGIPDHGPRFKQAYGKVYPWAKPGPITEYDPGTQRRVLWGQITRKVKRVK